jgi:hypothetical protein
MKNSAVYLPVSILILSLTFFNSSFSQTAANNDFSGGAAINEINLAWEGFFYSPDDGKTLAPLYADSDSIYFKSSGNLQVIARYNIVPNPSSGKSKLKIQLKQKDDQVVLYDLTGRLLSRISVDPDQRVAEINVENLNKGIYILKILSREMVSGIEKIVIN